MLGSGGYAQSMLYLLYVQILFLVFFSETISEFWPSERFYFKFIYKFNDFSLHTFLNLFGLFISFRIAIYFYSIFLFILFCAARYFFILVWCVVARINDIVFNALRGAHRHRRKMAQTV